jgi:prepilin-type N-terminal cleavage/methylation domain-containing protein
LGQAIKGLDGAAINIEHAAGEELLVKLKIMQRVKGVTLIELVVSIAILAIVVIAFSGMFVNGFKSIIKSGNRSSSDYRIQETIENKILNPVPGTENNVTTEVKNGNEALEFFYDDKGEVCGFKQFTQANPSGTGLDYFYLRNGQNDITGILDSTGAQVVSYVYDTWGKLVSITGSLASTIGALNPYRYRGYRYDTETGLYYLNSRYYNCFI